MKPASAASDAAPGDSSRQSSRGPRQPCFRLRGPVARRRHRSEHETAARIDSTRDNLHPTAQQLLHRGSRGAALEESGSPRVLPDERVVRDVVIERKLATKCADKQIARPILGISYAPFQLAQLCGRQGRIFRLRRHISASPGRCRCSHRGFTRSRQPASGIALATSSDAGCE